MQKFNQIIGISLLLLCIYGFIGCNPQSTTQKEPLRENNAQPAAQTAPEAQTPTENDTTPPAQPEVVPEQQNDEPTAPKVPAAEENPDSNDSNSAAAQDVPKDENQPSQQTPKIIGMDSSEFNEFYCEATLKYLDRTEFITKREIYKNIKDDAINKMLEKGCMKFCEASSETERPNCMNDCQQKAVFESAINCIAASPKPKRKNMVNID